MNFSHSLSDSPLIFTCDGLLHFWPKFSVHGKTYIMLYLDNGIFHKTFLKQLVVFE